MSNGVAVSLETLTNSETWRAATYIPRIILLSIGGSWPRTVDRSQRGHVPKRRILVHA